MAKVTQEKKVTLQMFPKEIGRSLRGLPIYATNPFLSQFSVNLSERKMTVARGASVVDKEGEIVAPATYAQIHEVDNEAFVKLYTTNLKTFFDLSRPAYKVLGCVFHAIQISAINRDKIFLNHYKANEIYQGLTLADSTLTETTYLRGVKELLGKEFIAEAPEGPGFFYINPNLVFSGDRVRFVTEYRKTPAYEEARERLQSLLEQGQNTPPLRSAPQGNFR